MKLIKSSSLTSASAVLAGLIFSSANSYADQLAYEGFDYAAGVDALFNQNGGTGWGGTWQTVNNGSADIVSASLTAGANAPAGFDLRSLGNSCTLPNNRRVGRFLDTTASGPFASYLDGNNRIGADGTTIYVSFVQQANGTSAYYEFEFHRGNLGDGGRIGGIGNDQGGDNVNLRAPNGTHTVVGPGNSGVNFYVVRIDFKAGNDDVFVYQNPTSTTEPGVPTLTRLAAADMSFDGLSFGAFNNGRTVSHDEVRVGESWQDVTLAPVGPPVIASQPRSMTTGYVGTEVVLEAEVNGYPQPTYQWSKGGVPISGATSSSLTLSDLQLTDAGDYSVTATNSEGAVISDDATVSVVEAPETLLAYEGFDYDAGAGNTVGKNGGIGWESPWVNVNGDSGNIVAGSLVAGNNGPLGYDAESLGNSSFVPNAQRDGRMLDTSPGGRFGLAGYIDEAGNIGADGTTIYLSFLQQPNGTSLFYEFEFHRDDLGDPGRVGGVGNDTSDPVIRLRTGGVQNTIGAGSTGVNLYVVRIDFKEGNDDVFVYQNPISATEPSVATLTVTDASDMSFDGISFGAFVNGRTVKHDEVRVGQNWSDVMFGASRLELVWEGDGVTNEWDFTSANWDDGSSTTQFSDGDAVIFDDFGSDSPAVNLTTDVSTSKVTFDNSNNDYTIGGVGMITSSSGLLKDSPGAVILNAPASFGGAVVMSEGSLTLGSTASFDGGFDITDGTVVLSGNNTFTGGLTALAGTQILSGTNTFAGLITGVCDTTITGPTSVVGTGGTVWFGNLGGADATLTIEPGGSLEITGILGDALVFGRDGGNAAVTQNGGLLSYDPSNRDSAFIGASNGGGTVASYDMNDGVIEMSNMRLGLAIGPITATLNHVDGDINVRQLELGSITGTGTGIYNLTNGTLTVGEGGITSASGLYEMNLDGGTIRAVGDWDTNLDMNLTGVVGDLIFDSNGNSVSFGGFVDGIGGLVKTGDGALKMLGINNYSGPTLVSEGTLGGFGNSDFSALTVASGASVAPGDLGVGDFYAESAVFQTGSTLEIEIDSSFDTADQLLAVDGDITISGANVVFTEIGFGIVPSGTVLTILDYSAGNLIGTFAGLAEGATVSVGSNTFTLSYVDSSQVTLTSTTVATPYQTWASANGLDGSPGKDPAFEADPDGDGVSNGLEFMLGGDPLASDGGSLITSVGDENDGITLMFTRNEASLDLDLFVQYDDALDGGWTDVPVEPFGGTYDNGVVVTVDDSGSPDAVTVQIPASNAVAGKLFARLLAAQP